MYRLVVLELAHRDLDSIVSYIADGSLKSQSLDKGNAD